MNVITPDVEPAAEAGHLRRLLDTQPSCLLRVARSGEILAANDAALGLLGVDGRREALGASMSRWIRSDQIESWNEFVGRVVDGAHGAPTSLETHLVLQDVHRRVLLNGIPLVDHPDGVASVILAAHDISERILLEATIERMREAVQARCDQLEAAATRRPIEDRVAQDQVRLQEELGERTAKLDAADARQEQLSADLMSAQAAIEEQRRLTTTAVADAARIHEALEAVEARYRAAIEEMSQVTADRQRLQAVCDEREAAPVRDIDILAILRKQHRTEVVSLEDQRRLTAEFETERGRLQETIERLAASHQVELSREAAEQQRLQIHLELAGQQHQELQARLHTLESEQKASTAGHAAERVRLEQLVAAAEAARDKQTEIAANREVVVAAMAQQARRLAPLASTGSVACDLAPQLKELVERVDTLAGRVLEACRLDTPGRADVELLRAEAVRAAALTAELLRAGTGPDADSVRRVILDRRRNKHEGRP